MSPFLSPCHSHQDTLSNSTNLYPCQREYAVTCSILQQSCLFDVVQPPFPFHSLLSLSWHSFLQHPPQQMVSISPSEVPKILQLPPLDLFPPTATLFLKILIPTIPALFFIHRLIYDEKRASRKHYKILSIYFCIITHTSLLFAGMFIWCSV